MGVSRRWVWGFFRGGGLCNWEFPEGGFGASLEGEASVIGSFQKVGFGASLEGVQVIGSFQKVGFGASLDGFQVSVVLVEDRFRVAMIIGAIWLFPPIRGILFSGPGMKDPFVLGPYP